MVLASKPHGEICTVIDEGVLNTETVGALRRWLFEKCHVLAVIRLPKETFAPNKINVRSSVLYLRRREHDDIDGEDNYAISFCSLDSLGYDGEGERQRGFDDARLIDEVVQSLLDHRLGNERHGYHWHAFDVDSRTVLGDGTCRLDYKYWSPAVRQRSDAMRTHGSPTITGLLTARRGKSPSADTYVDQQDGYALVVKAGNVSKYGDLIARGDYIERNIYDEIPTAHIKEGDILLASTGDGTLGKCCVYRSDAPAVADQHVTIIRGDQNKIWPEYLCDYLRAGFGARQIERLYTGSTGQIELTLRHVNDIVLDLSLTIAEQKHVSKELRKQENDYLAVVEQAESSLREARRQFFGDMDVTL
jgi:type I restriction enzyme M protein